MSLADTVKTARFLDPLLTEEISDSVFQTVAVFRYFSDIAGLITVPALFYTDFASVPRWMPLMYALLGDTAHMPAVIHDWLFYCAIVPFNVANQVLLEAMEVCGMPWWRRRLIYAGVCIGGEVAWNEHRRKGDPTAGKFADNPDIIRIAMIDSMIGKAP